MYAIRSYYEDHRILGQLESFNNAPGKLTVLKQIHLGLIKLLNPDLCGNHLFKLGHLLILRRHFQG